MTIGYREIGPRIFVAVVVATAWGPLACGGIADLSGETPSLEHPSRDAGAANAGGASSSGGSAANPAQAPPSRIVGSGGHLSGNSSTSPAAGSACSLVGHWTTISSPWNGLSTESDIYFKPNGTFTGTPRYEGEYSLDGETLVVRDTVGADMTCSYAATWTLSWASDCSSVRLDPSGDGCTGARRYLDWNVTLREPHLGPR
jgi:hypothetical protein